MWGFIIRGLGDNQTQSLAKYCVKTGCPNTHIPKRVCSVLSSRFFLVFGSNLAFAPKKPLGAFSFRVLRPPRQNLIHGPYSVTFKVERYVRETYLLEPLCDGTPQFN